MFWFCFLVSWLPIGALEIPTTNVSAGPGGRREGSSNLSRSLQPKFQQTPTSGSGGVSESPRGEYREVCGWRNTITRDPMDGRALGWPISMCLARLAMPPAE